MGNDKQKLFENSTETERDSKLLVLNLGIS